MTLPEMSVWQRIAAWWRELNSQELTVEETGW